MEPKEIHSKSEYLNEFAPNVREDALKNILDIRKFEIDLYWRRATYFWTFIGATFAGYLALANISNQKTINTKTEFLIIVLGLIFSLCWYFVNRGSKFWQLNWEKHLDVLEDEKIGPLYKTTIHQSYYKSRWWVIYGPYPFSVSKINILLSFIVFIIWSSIYFDYIISNHHLFFSDRCIKVNYYNSVNLILISSIVLICSFGRTGKPLSKESKTHIFFDKRGFSEEKSSKNNKENG